MLQIVYDLKTGREVSRKAWSDSEKDVPLEKVAPVIAKIVMEGRVEDEDKLSEGDGQACNSGSMAG